MFEAIGSYANRRSMFLVSRSLNGRKGKMFGGANPMSDVNMEDGVEDAIMTGKNEKVILQPIREVIATWRYLHHQDVLPRIQEARKLLNKTATDIATSVPQLSSLDEIFTEMEQDWLDNTAAKNLKWVGETITFIEREFMKKLVSHNPGNWGVVQKALGVYKNDMKYIKTLPPI
ncbi:mutanase [Colletotrichum kahawae]|uniref:Mutanase n=1 Tax=Colletotrichum kahawae TaxID=34407 RepID=A0AAD9YBG6_COLKA|nr:mutanase [Colletotrichum kahawae]